MQMRVRVRFGQCTQEATAQAINGVKAPEGLVMAALVIRTRPLSPGWLSCCDSVFINVLLCIPPLRHQHTCPAPPSRLCACSAMTAPKAACRPASESPSEMLGRTGGLSGYPFRCLPVREHKQARATVLVPFPLAMYASTECLTADEGLAGWQQPQGAAMMQWTALAYATPC